MDSTPTLAQRRAQFLARSRRFEERGFDQQAAARFAASTLGPVDGPVLDVGTGKGLLAMALASRHALVVTVDPDAAEQELAALLAGEAGVVDRLRFVAGDAAHLPYPDGHFAAAASMLVLHHLTDPSPVLSEMVRTLRPDGLILLSDFSREGFEIVAAVHREEGRVHPQSGVTLDGAVDLLRESGFDVVRRVTAHLHDVAVFARRSVAVSQSTLDETRQAAHPHCFLCGVENARGLGLDFHVRPDGAVQAAFGGGLVFEGYPSTIHGGLLAALLDAAMTNCLFSRGIVAVTARLNVRYVEPGRPGSPLEVVADLDRSTRGLHYLSAEVRQAGHVVARSVGTFTDRTRAVGPASIVAGTGPGRAGSH
jgi:SAM-dependent methyltransferase/acyl-coenzyme A thioesterase PaaI-like protein